MPSNTIVLKMKYEYLIVLGFFLTLFSLVLAQTQEIDLEHIGYGVSGRHAVFSIRNTGEVPLVNITLLLDGNEYEKIVGILAQQRGIKKTIKLDPGEHVIEVRSGEASDSLIITISSAEEKPKTTSEEETIFFPDLDMTWVGVGTFILIIIFVVVIWLLLRKPKLEMEESQLP